MMHKTNLPIEKYIEEFRKNSTHKNPVSYYTNGHCLAFALHLQGKYTGNITFLPAENHFVFATYGKLYDITGNVSKMFRNARKIAYEDIPEKIIKGFASKL